MGRARVRVWRPRIYCALSSCAARWRCHRGRLPLGWAATSLEADLEAARQLNARLVVGGGGRGVQLRLLLPRGPCLSPCAFRLNCMYRIQAIQAGLACTQAGAVCIQAASVCTVPRRERRVSHTAPLPRH